MPVGNSKGKGKAKANAVEEANKDLEDLDLSGIDFDSIGDPDATPEVPADDDTPDVPWEEDAPEVPGDDEDLSMADLGIPEPDNISILAEYLPALKDELATLVGMVQDQHNYHKTREASFMATVKGLTDSLGNRIDSLESSVHEVVSLFRAHIRSSAPKLEDLKHQDAVEPKKEQAKPAGKTPPAPKVPSIAEVSKALGLPKLAQHLAALRNLREGQELTIDKFKAWLSAKNVATNPDKLVEMLKLKGPITKDTFPAA